ncbi:putative breast cancer type 1 susceptibility protein brca1 [Fasciolopsis buskii]|uniref:Putative breast cancer type 1 susceptibility protein brca1 n=1 Tax=Fasciolopsis buskii TaxID=27845 RepID=A0A8E0S7X7_9TREM|nr:putative breast cancer type 1 susceptibility protein brca1 [Fasciolopsis buski]
MTCIEQCTCYSFQTPYEIEGDTVCGDHHEGPRRGRLKVPAVPHRADGTMIGPSDEDSRGPFTGLWLCAFGSLGLLQLSDFMSLAHDGGASRVFEKPADLTAAMEVFLKLEAQKSTGVRRPRAMILTNHNPPEFDASKCLALYQTYGIPIISIDWMLNCISLYRRIPISQLYRICPCPTSNPPAPLAARNLNP